MLSAKHSSCNKKWYAEKQKISENLWVVFEQSGKVARVFQMLVFFFPSCLGFVGGLFLFIWVWNV